MIQERLENIIVYTSIITATAIAAFLIYNNFNSEIQKPKKAPTLYSFSYNEDQQIWTCWWAEDKDNNGKREINLKWKSKKGCTKKYQRRKK